MAAKPKKPSIPNGVVIYHGPGMIDGEDIVVIATGLKKSRNAKTGNMVQTWILRADLDPWDAVQSGDDSSVCGDCKHRGVLAINKKTGKLRNKGRSCYVKVFQAPKGVFGGYDRGIYPDAQANLEETFAGRAVRIGSYGDPAAVPFHVWERVLANAASHTGYTHQWERFPEFAGIVMASADSKAERAAAKMLGFRTFRVTADDASKRENRELGEFACPASKELNAVTTCAACQACGGNSSVNRADVVITVHGAVAKHNFKPNDKIAA